MASRRAEAAILRVALEMGRRSSSASSGVRMRRRQALAGKLAPEFGDAHQERRSRILRNVTVCRALARGSMSRRERQRRLQVARRAFPALGLLAGGDGGKLPQARNNALYRFRDAKARCGRADRAARAARASAAPSWVFGAPRAANRRRQGSGAAPARHGTRLAARRARRADRGAQLHHGLVPVAGRLRGQPHAGRKLHSRWQARARVAAAAIRRESRPVAPARARHCRRARRAARRRRCSTPPPRCTARCPAAPGPLPGRVGNFAAVPAHDLLCGAMQVARAAVIAEPGPAAQHGVEARPRQAASPWESAPGIAGSRESQRRRASAAA